MSGCQLTDRKPSWNKLDDSVHQESHQRDAHAAIRLNAGVLLVIAEISYGRSAWAGHDFGWDDDDDDDYYDENEKEHGNSWPTKPMIMMGRP